VDRKPEFLEVVKVDNFSFSHKWHNGKEMQREVRKRKNNNPEQEFVVIGKKMFNEGENFFIGYEEGYGFNLTARKTVYIVANKLHLSFYASIEDIVPLRKEVICYHVNT